MIAFWELVIFTAVIYYVEDDVKMIMMMTLMSMLENKFNQNAE